MAQERRRTDACILSGGPNGATYRRPRCWCCCPRRLVRPRVSGKERGGSHSFDLLRRPARDTAGPGSRAGHPTKLTNPAGFNPRRGSPCEAARAPPRTTSTLMPMSVSASAITSFSGWNSTIMKTTRRTGMIRMIVTANSGRHYLKYREVVLTTLCARLTHVQEHPARH